MTNFFQLLAARCDDGGFLGFPFWHRGLEVKPDADLGSCTVIFDDISSVWVIVANIVQILITLGTYVAVVMIFYAALTILTSQGNPEKIAQGRGTLIYSLIGFAITILAITIISYGVRL